MSTEHAARRVLLLGLGNAILCDDGVGIQAVRRIADAARSNGFEVREAEVAGFSLLDLLDGFDAAVVVDAARMAGCEPGEIRILDVSDMLPSLHLVAGHQIDLPNALALGREIGVAVPSEVKIVAVQIEDDRTFSESCTPAVEAAIDAAGRTALEVAHELRTGA